METKPRFDAVQVSALLGCTRGHVCRLCKRHGVGQLERNAYRLTGKDIDRLKKIIEEGNPRRKRGRPKNKVRSDRV